MVIVSDVGDTPALACVPNIDQIVAKRHFGGDATVNWRERMGGSRAGGL